MSSSDSVLVPREPTEAMLLAARGLIMARDLQAPNYEMSLGKVSQSGFYGEHWRSILTEEERAITAPLTKAHLAQLIYRAMLAASPQQSPEPLDALIDDAFEKMKPFCNACQAIPKHGYCNMPGCPMPRPQQPADERLPPETGANHQDRGVTDWTDLRLAAEAAEWLERQPAGTFNANDIKHRFRKLATPRAVLALVEAADRAVSQ